MQRVSAQRRFNRLVVFRERTFRHFVDGKQASHPFRLHDKRPGWRTRCGIAEVRNIVTRPLAAVPLDQHPFRIPRFTIDIRRSTVVEHATVERPRPGPSQRIPQTGWVGVIAVSHLVALLCPATGVDPARRCGCTVITQMRKATQQLTFLRNQHAISVIEIFQRIAVILFRHFVRLRFVRLLVVPAHLHQRFYAFTTFGLVQLAQMMVDTRQNFAVVTRFARRVLTFPVPLQPATGVSDRTIFFGKAGRRQTEYFSLNRRRIDIVRLAVVLPEGRGFSHQRIDNHHVLQLAQAAHHFVFVREGRNRVKALAEVTGDFAFVHHVEILDDVVGLVPLRQPVIAPVVLFLRGIAIERFHQANEELRIVAPVVHLISQRRFRRVRFQIRLQINLFF
ncbi:Uncharacterised protein [Shigella sonnei]|nr:Uncharacterised protein [Shigella sonnei]